MRAIFLNFFDPVRPGINILEIGSGCNFWQRCYLRLGRVSCSCVVIREIVLRLMKFGSIFFGTITSLVRTRTALWCSDNLLSFHISYFVASKSFPSFVIRVRGGIDTAFVDGVNCEAFLRTGLT